MFNWLRRRRLSADSRRKLLLASARAEEAVIETHVANILDLLDSLGAEVDFDFALELYSEMMSLDDARASTIATRLLSRLEKPESHPLKATASGNGRYHRIFREESVDEAFLDRTSGGRKR
ncbi:MAG: hypothetical protein LBG44_09240 [Gemmatimonadota bacterium]|jgi:hypothetical protein|nr:hypothetical protein [Gemmatimonadota bacterium]